jgi:uncharacterized membrane protein YuzA (DUF378 family)
LAVPFREAAADDLVDTVLCADTRTGASAGAARAVFAVVFLAAVFSAAVFFATMSRPLHIL